MQLRFEHNRFTPIFLATPGRSYGELQLGNLGAEVPLLDQQRGRKVRGVSHESEIEK